MKKLNLEESKEWFSIGSNEFGFACLGLYSLAKRIPI